MPSEDPTDSPGGKAAWADSREGREASLKERKERMILAARQSVLHRVFDTFLLLTFGLIDGCLPAIRARERRRPFETSLDLCFTALLVASTYSG